MKKISHSPEETRSIARKITKGVLPGDIVCLYGDLGSGKTVFAKGIAEGLGIPASKVISPSFVLIREHHRGRIPLYHFDLYRLEEPADITALGYEEYLFGRGVCVIEWPQRLKFILPKEFLKVELQVAGGSKRRIQITACGNRYRGLLKRAG